MRNIKINSTVKIYFSISWILGILTLVSTFLLKDDDISLVFWFVFMGFNFLVNSIALVQLLVLILTFSENRKEFFGLLFYCFSTFLLSLLLL